MDINKNRFITEDEANERGAKWWPSFEIGQEVEINGYLFRIDEIDIEKNVVTLKPWSMSDSLAEKVQGIEDAAKEMKYKDTGLSYKEGLERYLNRKKGRRP